MTDLIDDFVKSIGDGPLRKVLLGIVIPILVLSTTYSSVFFMKGEVGWSLFYGGVMGVSGWLLFNLTK